MASHKCSTYLLLSFSHSLHSDVSVPDISDLSPSHASPHFSSMSAILSIQNDELDDVWRSHVRRVIMDEPATQNVNTFHLFARLFQVRSKIVVGLRLPKYLVNFFYSLPNIETQNWGLNMI